jgi:hypothetical protein
VRELKLITALLLLIILCQSAFSTTIGVSPSIIRQNKMIKEGYAETAVVVSTSTVQPLRASLAAEGEIAEWITFLPSNLSFVFSRDEPYSFVLIIQPPEDAQNGNYSGMLKITTDELATVERGAGSSVIAQVGLLIYVEVTGEEVIECRAGAISTSHAEIGQPFTVRTTVHNDGNVRIRPQITIDVWDQYRTKIVFSRSLLGDQILPTKSRDISREIENSLPLGQYFADVYVRECDVLRTTSFDIVERGRLQTPAH